jgi:hypothetical protein
MAKEHHRFCDDNGWDHPGKCVVEITRPEDHIDDHVGPIVLDGIEPIDHGFGLFFRCARCDYKWTGAIDFDEMEVSDE